MKIHELRKYYQTSVMFGVLMLCHIALGYSQEGNVQAIPISKRMDIATCLAKFDVKTDMIIRTEESRKLGAVFLDNADVGARVECLHLCCETEKCDVFVFEEKGQGTCFLFHCGPAQNFRCKFTKHANYTSAVFSSEKRVVQPTVSPIKALPVSTLSQHEMELKSLKEKIDLHTSANAKGAESAATTSTTTKAIAIAVKNGTSKCSRFQFQCHSGECIAVYNACDGIPQCEDGSDEGPECQAITRTPDQSANKLAPGVGRVQLISTNDQSSGNQNFVGHNREDPMTSPQWPQNHQFPNAGENSVQQLPSADQQSLLAQYPHQQFPINAYNAPKDAYRTWNGAADPNLLSNWPQQMPQFPIKPIDTLQQKQPVFTQYQPDLMQQELSAVSQQQQQQQQQQQYNWPIIAPNLPILSNNNHPNHANEEVLPQKDAIGVIKDVPVADRKKDGKNTLVQSKSDSASTEDSDYNNDEDDEPTTEPPKKKKKHRKVNKVDKVKSVDETKPIEDSEAQQMKMLHASLHKMDHDGEAERPSGAVVSLVLGILVTIGLVMVVSCRTTTVRKRVRRGAKGYSHDADFLVNGMYL